jgi:peptide/nickel transport system substrate-binding protein
MNLKSALLGAVCAFAMAPAAFAERGTDGEVKLTFPQAVSIMNPYLSSGTKTSLPPQWWLNLWQAMMTLAH